MIIGYMWTFLNLSRSSQILGELRRIRREGKAEEALAELAGWKRRDNSRPKTMAVDETDMEWFMMRMS
jgi:hypothetical protein